MGENEDGSGRILKWWRSHNGSLSSSMYLVCAESTNKVIFV
jgi:hypothetical protein